MRPKGIGIVGAGIAGLHLGLFLRKHGIDATIYTDRSSRQMLEGRLPNAVARFAPTRARERELGVDHWDCDNFGISCAHVSIMSDPPLRFCGRLGQPASFVDMRIYQAALLDDFRERGGWVVVGTLQAGDVADLSEEHDLVVVAAGRGSLAEMFPRIPEHSPFDKPQRVLCAALHRGIAHPEPLGFAYTVSPGVGQVFQAPFYSFEGRVTAFVWEAIPGGPFEAVGRARYEDDPGTFEATELALLRAYAPDIYARVDLNAFGITRAIDVLQGAITPVVRRGYARLGNGKYAVAIGDVSVLNDPLTGQGANIASRSAWALGEAILEGGRFDEEFCRCVEARIWDYAKDVTAHSNAALQPPAPYLEDFFGAAVRDQRVADAFVGGFNDPQELWSMLSSREAVSAALRRLQRQEDAVMEVTA